MGTQSKSAESAARNDRVLRVLAGTLLTALIGLPLAGWGQRAPTNDLFANRVDISELFNAPPGITFLASNTGASKEPGEPDHAENPGGKSVWSTWTASGDGVVIIETTGSSFDTLLAVYRGDALASLSLVASNDDADDNTSTSRVTFSVVTGVAYQIAVDGYDGESGEIVFDIRGVVAPPNDAFAKRIIVTDATVAVTGSNVDATKEANEPNHADNPGGASVWWTWTAPDNEVVTIDTLGSSFDTLLAVYKGDSLSGLSPVASNDEANNETSTSRATFSAVSGTVYQIAVDGHEGDTGDVVLRIRPPANDAFANRKTFTGATVAVTGSSVGATKEASEPNHADNPGGASVWWTWTAPDNEVVTIDTLGSSFDTLLAVYKGDSLSGLSPVASNDEANNETSTSRVTFSAISGTVYQIAVDGHEGDTGDVVLRIRPPANDAFANRKTFTGATVAVTGSSVGATKEASEPDHADDPGGASVWWTWTAPANGVVTVDTLGSSFDTLLAVYTGGAISSLALVENNDDDGDEMTSRLSFRAVAGTQYQIAVDGYGGSSGTIVLSLASEEPKSQVEIRKLGEWPGYVRGAVQNVRVQGDLAYLAARDGGLWILDVSDRSTPRWVGGYNTDGSANDIVLVGTNAFVADGANGLQIFDVSRPSGPQWVGGYSTYGQASGVSVSGAYAYVAAGNPASFEVIDIRDLSNPRAVGRWAVPRNGHEAVFVSGAHAYLASRYDGLQTIDITDPTNPRLIASHATSYATDVFVSGNYAYIADGEAGLKIIDVSNPTSPRQVGSYDTAQYAWGVSVLGTTAYVGDFYGLQVIDITNPASPKRIGGIDTPGYGGRAFISGDYAYLADHIGGLAIIDLSNAASLRLAGTFGKPGEAIAVFVTGTYAYLADRHEGLQVIDIHETGAPRRIGQYSTTDDIRTLFVSDSYAYIGGSGLSVIDLKDPTNPQRIASVRGSDSRSELLNIKDIFVSANSHFAFVADYVSGLHIFDVSIPSSPRRIGGYKTDAFGVVVFGAYAYVAGSGAGLQVIDVSEPANPRLIGAYDTPGSANGISVAGVHAYVADGYAGVQIIDVSEPSKPRLVATYNTPGYTQRSVIADGYLYIPNDASWVPESSGLLVLDVHDPAKPRSAGSYDSEGEASAIVVKANRAFLADGSRGLIQLEITGLHTPPLIQVQPIGGAFSGDRPVSVEVTAFGDPPLTYQWSRNNTAISSATNSVLTIDSLGQAQAGDYRVEVRNAFGSALSKVAKLSINEPPTISSIPNQVLPLNTPSPVLPFTVFDKETPASRFGFLFVEAISSSNPDLVPLANIFFGGSDTNRQVYVIPAVDRTGATTIFLTVTDEAGSSASTSFTVTVTPSPSPAPGIIEGTIHAILPLPDGKTLIGGTFTNINGIPRNRIARLNSDDSLDLDFSLDLNGRVSALFRQDDGKIVIGGGFTRVAGVYQPALARLTATGDSDTTFRPFLSEGPVSASALAKQIDGTYALAGSFYRHLANQAWTSFGLIQFDPSRPGLVSLDTERHLIGASALAIQFDGKLLAAGGGSGSSNQVLRFNLDGSIDKSFVGPADLRPGGALLLAVQLNEKILVAGNFTNIHGTGRSRIARLNSNGSLDSSFAPSAGPNGTVNAITLQADGRSLIGGAFTNFNGVVRNRIARLNPDGSLDTTYDPRQGFNGTVFALATLPDGAALAGGDFTTFDGAPRSRFARIPSTSMDAVETVSFASGLYAVDEAATKAAIWIKRTGRGTGAIRVQLSVIGGTARRDRDYALPASFVVFADGETSDTLIEIPLSAENSTPGDDRTIELALSNPVGARLISNRSSATVEIMDNDSGLLGGYFDERGFQSVAFTNLTQVRIDPEICFDWSSGPPAPTVSQDFAAVWKGFVVPEFSEDYTFYTLSDDEDRLWVDGKLLIDDWGRGYTFQERAGKIRLNAGQQHEIELHFADSGGGPAGVRLSWSSPSQAKQIIPRARLLPAASLFSNPLAQARIGISTNRLLASVVQSHSAGRSMSVWNEGGETLTYTASTDVSWLTVAPRTGAILALGARVQSNLRIFANSTELSSGEHLGRVIIEGDFAGSPKVIDVLLDVVEPGPLDSWHWRNPLPQGDNLLGVEYVRDRFIGFGSVGQIITSRDGLTWNNQPFGLDVSLGAVAYGNGIFVGVEASSGRSTIVSSDGVSWKLHDTNQGRLRAVGFGNRTFVAVGDDGLIVTSPDGVNWKRQDSSTTGDLQDLIFANGLFIAVGWPDGTSSNIVSSRDGQTWKSENSGSRQQLYSVAFGNGVFIAAGSPSDRVLVSTDGVLWTLHSLGEPTTADAVVFGEGTFVAIAREGIFSSKDGKAWTRRYTSDIGLTDLSHGADRFVVVGSYGLILTSADGAQWVPHSSGPTVDLNGVLSAPEIIVAVGDAGSISTSTDRVTWNVQTSGAEASLNRVALGGGRIVVVGARGTILSSADASGWRKENSGTTNNLNAVMHNAGIFAAVGDAGTLLTSPDGSAWTQRTSPVLSSLRGITSGSGQFVAVGNSGTIVTSPDGTSWTERASGTVENLLGIAFGDGRFVAVGGFNTVLISHDGVTWTSGGPITARDVIFSRVGFVATGFGVIHTSPDGTVWTTHDTGFSGSLSGIAFTEDRLIAVGEHGGILESASIPPQPPTIAREPEDLVVSEGIEAILSVKAVGSLPLRFQWQFNGLDLSGATNATLKLPRIGQNNSGDYRVQVQNAFGATVSGVARLSVVDSPLVTLPTDHLSVVLGGDLTLTAVTITSTSFH